MNFQVMSKDKAVKYSFHPYTERSAIISITNLWDMPVKFSHEANIKRILHIFFDDVEKGEKNVITFEDGKKIKEFVDDCLKDNIELLIVHCSAGVSRSAGVCAAIMKAVTGNDMDIFDNPHFCPNMTCYRTVLEAFIRDIDEDELQQELNINIQKWRELNEIE